MSAGNPKTIFVEEVDEKGPILLPGGVVVDGNADELRVELTEQQPSECGGGDGALTFGYAAGDSASGVTQNLTLPATGSDSSTIAWASSAATAVSAGRGDRGWQWEHWWQVGYRDPT